MPTFLILLTMSTLAQSLKQGTMGSFEEGIFGHYSQSYYLWPEKQKRGQICR